MGDIKLLPPFWGQGLGTEGMRSWHGHKVMELSRQKYERQRF
jgi:hypothetical protein